jgi:uncharacterized membrane protein
MSWFWVGTLVLGTLLGVAFRFMLFLAVLVIVVALAVASGHGGGIGTMLLDGVLAAIALQVGYVVGLLIRALLDRFRGRRAALSGRRSRYLRYLSGLRR